MKRLVHQDVESTIKSINQENKEKKKEIKIYWDNDLSVFGFDNIGELYFHRIVADDETRRTVIRSDVVNMHKLITVSSLQQRQSPLVWKELGCC